MAKGWVSESTRHALARKGIKTGRKRVGVEISKEGFIKKFKKTFLEPDPNWKENRRKVLRAWGRMIEAQKKYKEKWEKDLEKM